MVENLNKIFDYDKHIDQENNQSMERNSMNIKTLDIAVTRDNLQETNVKNYSYIAFKNSRKELKNHAPKEKYLVQSPGDNLSENDLLDTSNNSELYLIQEIDKYKAAPKFTMS